MAKIETLKYCLFRQKNSENMFSAKSGDKTYTSGMIPDPRSREYACKNCGNEVFYVKPARREIRMSAKTIEVPEHFRHTAGASHPVRSFNYQSARAIEALIKNFSTQEGTTLETDPQFTQHGRTYLGDILVREPAGEGKTIDTIVTVEAGPFRSNNIWDSAIYYSSIGMNHLLILVANDPIFNPEGKYFRDEFRESTGKKVKIVDGNEAKVYEAFKRNVYFDPSSKTFKVARFLDYREPALRDVTAPSGYVIIQKGEIQELKTRKTPVVKDIAGEFILDQHVISHRGRNLRIALPLQIDSGLTFDKLLEIEDRAEKSGNGNLSERAAIAIIGKLESLDPEEYSLAKQKYGASLGI